MGTTVAQDVWIDAPVDVVWRTVTEPELVARWFADRVDVRAVPGDEGSLTFGDSLTVRVTVQSVEPPRRFCYRWLHPDGVAARPGTSVLVTFTLAPESGGTRLRVVESELDEMGWTPEATEAFRAEHTRGWATHFGRLRDLLTGAAP
jgi:uncharacterized protein YndB with AHSA1/START domain